MKKGFTIVELLIVVVVIAILAAITIVSYNGITKRATEVSLKSDLRNTASKLAVATMDNSTYPSSLSSSDKVESSANALTYAANGATFCLSATTKQAGGPSFFITEAGTIQTGTCQPTWSQISMGATQVVALASNGKVYTWGSNNFGELGNGNTGTASSTPVDISNSGALAGKTIVQVSSGSRFSTALDSNGVVYTWGYNPAGQLGNGTTTNTNTPGAVIITGKTITQISAVAGSVLARASDGTLYAWGPNANGQVGNGTTTQQLSPISISNSGTLAGKSITQVSAGSFHSLALASDGTVHAWGNNTDNQLGNGNTTQQLSPINITSFGALAGKTITQVIASGGSHSAAIDSTGALYMWGLNSTGQLGDNTIINKSTPISLSTSGVLSGKNVAQVSMGANYTVARISDGTVYAWGANSSNQLGDGSTTQRNTPVAIAGAMAGKTITKLSGYTAGGTYGVAIDSAGTLYAWGLNSAGQLGDGSTTTRTTPVLVSDGP